MSDFPDPRVRLTNGGNSVSLAPQQQKEDRRTGRAGPAGPVLEIVIVLLLILLNGVFALSELAIVSARRSRLTALAAEGRHGANRALALAADPGRFLSTVQIGITAVGLIAGAYSGAALTDDVTAYLLQKGVPEPAAGWLAYVAVFAADHLPLADRRRAGAEEPGAAPRREHRLHRRAADDHALAHRRAGGVAARRVDQGRVLAVWASASSPRAR